MNVAAIICAAGPGSRFGVIVETVDRTLFYEADLNYDSKVDFKDYALLAEQWAGGP
jgi:CTP:molybdopterin cytidylyltransferase MocA